MKIEMKGAAVGVEMASDGRIVDRKEILQRGLLVVGRRLLEEERSGTKRDLSAVEQRALDVARSAEQSAAPPVEEPKKEEPAEVVDPMIEIYRARIVAEEQQ